MLRFNIRRPFIQQMHEKNNNHITMPISGQFYAAGSGCTQVPFFRF